ncbi:hypothetical protein [Rhizobium sp. P44RR-XXIV]|uniref:hypothetical protein n=1 Tax=Rhizobium sp. P44RR-XXIV TaxID=1921145 RepID=UPI000986DBD0|nr:hypothetical protein [Rhizobium sp. P44RR-XXIV]TIX90785.1 hypothetical protein BSK43_016190 [Rhizobium sp. P44RR-XXIV]
MDIQFPEFEIFAPKVELAWTALERQYAGRITGAELDHLFACLVFGLTSPAYAAREPALHFDVCRALVAMKLPADRADTALHTVPEPTQPWVEGAREQVESQAARMGRMLQEIHNFNDDTAADADQSALSRSDNSEDKAA